MMRRKKRRTEGKEGETEGWMERKRVEKRERQRVSQIDRARERERVSEILRVCVFVCVCV